MIVFFFMLIPFISFAQSDSTHWQYSQSRDELTGAVSRMCYIYSTNVAQFKFPYDGGSRAWIMIENIKPNRRSGRGRYQFHIGITRGQIDASGYDNENVFQVRFDNNKPTLMYYGNYSDNNNHVLIFPDGPSIGIIASGRMLLKTFVESHILLIRIPVYNEGSFDFKFNIDNLDLTKL